MYKIDRTTWEQMSSNTSKIVKQWNPAPHVVASAVQPEVKKETEPEEKPEIKEEAKPEIKPIPMEEIEREKKQILATAFLEGEEIKKKAYSEGYSEGVNDSKEKFREICEKHNEEFDKILNELEADKQQVLEKLGKETLSLSIAIAEKILNIKIENDDKIIVGMIKDTLNTMEKDERFVLKLNSQEYEKHFKDNCESLQEELQSEVPIKIVKDSTLKKGAFILESDKGFVDASVDTQLGKIADSLTQRDSQYHEAL